MTTPWFILGGGSLGCLLAGYLHRAGLASRLILRDAASVGHARQEGVSLTVDGHSERYDDLILFTPAQLTAPISRLIICTKAHQTLAAVNSIASMLAPRPLLVLMQNGMGIREQLLARWPTMDLLHGITTEGAYQSRRFQVVHAGHGETVIGATATPMPADLASASAEVAALFTQAGLAARPVADCERRLWLKLVVNSVINPLTALNGCRNGELRRLPAIDDTIASLCEEAAAVASAHAVALGAPELIALVNQVIDDTASNRSSMLQDMDAHRPTEIDFINGFLVRAADQAGVTAPNQRALFEAVKHRESL